MEPAFGYESRLLVQGVGAVGANLARLLAAEGADVWLTDVDLLRARRVAAEIDGVVVFPDEVLETEADVFAPCAAGGGAQRAIDPPVGMPGGGGVGQQPARHAFGRSATSGRGDPPRP